MKNGFPPANPQSAIRNLQLETGCATSIQDTSLRILHQNVAMRRKFGDQLGRRCHQAYYQSQSICPECDVRQTLAHGTPMKAIKGWTSPDGQLEFHEIVVTPLRDEKGNITGVEETIHDVTARTMLERRLIDESEKLERALRELQETEGQLIQSEKMASLGMLVAGIAHEINTPVGAIISTGDTLERLPKKLGEASRAGDEEQLDRLGKLLAEALAVNRIACDRIVQIVASLKNFVRLDEAEVKMADLHEGIESTLLLVAHEIKGRVEIERDYGPIPEIPCRPNQLNQVFLNLVMNAVQAIRGKGTIKIETRQEGNEVVLRFSDTGHGIKPQNLARIFEPQFTTKGPGLGMGFGLSICNQIIAAHGGIISADSVVGKGTTIAIRLPIRQHLDPPLAVLTSR